jgi:putative transposase
MKYNPDVHHRRSIRLKGYDYSHAGAYFITVCTHDRKYIFGKIENGKMILNDFGNIVTDEWMKSAVTKRINEIRNTPGAKLWQRNYYEHIIRNENEINRIRQYIINNPIEWASDRNNPNSVVREPIKQYGNESWRI